MVDRSRGCGSSARLWGRKVGYRDLHAVAYPSPLVGKYRLAPRTKPWTRMTGRYGTSSVLIFSFTKVLVSEIVIHPWRRNTRKPTES